MTEQDFIIKRLAGDIVIKKSKIKEIKVVDHFNDIYMRSFASGGMFGYFGTYILNNDKKATVYCTRWNGVVTIRTEEEFFIISPTDAERFCQTIGQL